MRRLYAIPLITIVSASVLAGCTMMPASQETGVGPQEYAEIKNAGEVKKENEELKNELDSMKSEVKKMEKDYIDLAKNNDNLLAKLEEAESKLDILANEAIPEFKSEKTDKNSIVTYLNNNKSILEKRLKGIEIVTNSDEESVLFYTVGYGEGPNQMFMWSTGDSEPVMVTDANFEKDGKLNWIDGRFLEITSGSGNYKILDTKSKSVVSSFSSKHAHLIPDTSSYVLQEQDGGAFVVYDFINSKKQDITMDYKGKVTEFEVSGSTIIFKGNYTDDYETQYSVSVSMNMDKLKEQYGVLSLEKALELKETGSSGANNETTENMETIESTDEGTV